MMVVEEDKANKVKEEEAISNRAQTTTTEEPEVGKLETFPFGTGVFCKS